jgi:hypothetical protein
MKKVVITATLALLSSALWAQAYTWADTDRSDLASWESFVKDFTRDMKWLNTPLTEKQRNDVYMVLKATRAVEGCSYALRYMSIHTDIYVYVNKVDGDYYQFYWYKFTF